MGPAKVRASRPPARAALGKIRETRHERLHERNRKLGENPPLAAHCLGAHGKEPARG